MVRRLVQLCVEGCLTFHLYHVVVKSNICGVAQNRQRRDGIVDGGAQLAKSDRGD